MPCCSNTATTTQPRCSSSAPRSPTQSAFTNATHTCQVCSDTTRFPIRPERCPLTGLKIQVPEGPQELEAAQELEGARSVSNSSRTEDEHRFGIVLPSPAGADRYLTLGKRAQIEGWIEHCRRVKCWGFKSEPKRD
jgi:hypothetical protein